MPVKHIYSFKGISNPKLVVIRKQFKAYKCPIKKMWRVLGHVLPSS